MATPSRIHTALVTLAALLGAAVLSSAADAATSAEGPASVSGTLPRGTFDVHQVLPPVTGKVTGPGASRSTVQVQARANNGTWVPLHSTTARADGSYTLHVPTWWAGRHTLRIAVPGTATGETSQVNLVREQKPLPGRAHAYVAGTSRVRWNPCTVHSYRINPRGAWKGYKNDVRATFEQISEATGLRFRYAGTTRYVGWTLHPGSYPAGASFTVSWAKPSALRALLGAVVGVGGASWSGHEFSQGRVTLDSTWRLRGQRSWVTRQHRLLLLHELGHAVGLGHVGDERQVMHPSLQDLPGAYSAGDLAGLETLGANQGCVGSRSSARAGDAGVTSAWLS